MPPAELTGMMYSTCPFIRPSFTILANLIFFENQWNSFDASWHKQSSVDRVRKSSSRSHEAGDRFGRPDGGIILYPLGQVSRFSIQQECWNFLHKIIKIPTFNCHENFLGFSGVQNVHLQRRHRLMVDVARVHKHHSYSRILSSFVIFSSQMSSANSDVW